MKPEKKLKTRRIAVDVPDYVHEYLNSLHGNKKNNAEIVLMAEAKRNGFKPE